MPLAYTELHHLAWWRRDHGPTNQHNCAPYCSYHHHDIHRLAITVTRRADGSLEHRYPDGRRYGAPPDDGDQGRSLPSAQAAPAERDGSGGAGDGLPSAAPCLAEPDRPGQEVRTLASAVPASTRDQGPPLAAGRSMPSPAPADAGRGEDPPADLLALLSA